VGGRQVPARESGSEELLDPGFFNETITDAALGGQLGAAEAPSQSTLRSQPESLLLTGQLPTQAEVSGDAETQSAISEARALLAFGGDSSDDSDGLASLVLGDEDDGGGLL
jgi:hypothetical protein